MVFFGFTVRGEVLAYFIGYMSLIPSFPYEN